MARQGTARPRPSLSPPTVPLHFCKQSSHTPSARHRHRCLVEPISPDPPRLERVVHDLGCHLLFFDRDQPITDDLGVLIDRVPTADRGPGLDLRGEDPLGIEHRVGEGALPHRHQNAVYRIVC